MTAENPFVVYSPEELTPEEFKEIFVKEHTWINALETLKDFFIYGSRGSGKSMLLNYLEFSHQLYYFENNLIKFFEEGRGHEYIGIMVHVTQEELNTARYELLIENNFAEKGFITDICMSDLVMAILYRILKTFIETEEMAEYINTFDSEKIKEFCVKEIDDLDKQHIYTPSFDKQYANIKLLATLADIFLKERTSIKYYANEKFQMKDAVYKGNYSSFAYMHDFITRFKKLLSMRDFSFYILLDNADETKNIMQLCIDSLISQRQHKDVSVKIAVRKGVHWDKGDIQCPHDYSQINIDELYSTQHTLYYGRIREIVAKRLELADIGVTIEEFFPESPNEKQLLQQIKGELKEKHKKEYNEKYGDKTDDEYPSKSDYINNRVNKYAQAELFRRLKKTGKSYAGFDSIVHLSSGIIRQFLDISSYMFDEEVKRKGGENINQISLKTQSDVIKKYADDFMDELERKYKGFEKEENIEEAKLYKNLYRLIETLGIYYKKRLMNPELKEPRVFTFTLKDPNENIEIEKILEIGVNENYFQSYWYSSKIGLGKYRGYAFNRRLCPRYGIDHTSFRGRIELTTADLKRAIKAGKIPKSAFRDEEKEYVTLDLFSGGE